MWNFLVSSLTIGCTLVLYDGSPLRDASLLWKLVDELGITIFGTSAKYLDQLSVIDFTYFNIPHFPNITFEQKTYRPREHHNLRTLRQIHSTGSPLAPALFDYVYEHIHPDVLLASITGEKNRFWEVSKFIRRRRNGHLLFICWNVYCTPCISRGNSM